MTVSFDFQSLKQQLMQATQAAFLEMLAQHPVEGFYSFASSGNASLKVCHLNAHGEMPDDAPKTYMALPLSR
ncbi:hypothetical protein DNI29_17730 [Hymenobacter sediminis]|uniref:hypothetical protein n=1 Tax=Hymenobacter sediminis TaxID=2218621 RepID=UPI000F4D6258|nr:hypothetical protein [Hymenobacter sediminis]RPD45233.1 hypothetical protein DNI29_17730 [Hymenobacter sediminis]